MKAAESRTRFPRALSNRVGVWLADETEDAYLHLARKFPEAMALLNARAAEKPAMCRYCEEPHIARPECITAFKRRMAC